jgi:predicted PurR-regulated permease PerM
VNVCNEAAAEEGYAERFGHFSFIIRVANLLLTAWPAMRRMRIDITGSAIIKVLAAIVVAWLWLRLWQWVLLMVVAAFLAVGLDPFVSWLDARGVRRRYGAPLVVLAIALMLVAFVYFASTSLIEQGQLLATRIEEFQRDVSRRIPARLMEMLPGSGEAGPPLGTYVASFGRAVMSGLLSIGAALILTVYFLLDGRRTYKWLVAFARPETRPRVHQTAVEARKAVIGYVRGNVATSVICAICTYIVLVLLKVPAAFLLALLAGLFDFIPVIGFFIAAIPSVLLALMVSPLVAVAVAAFNLLYNAVENYYIAPKVYGSEMQLSSLAVILSFAVGAELGGVVGALIALPLAAMYPAVESIWLAKRLGTETVIDHRRIEQSDEH